MAKTYSEKLRDPRWQKKRLEILERDEWTCTICSAKDKTLHVHHLAYLKNGEPWDVSNIALITLCEDCHSYEEEAKKKSISELGRAVGLCGFSSCQIDVLTELLVNASNCEREPRVALIKLLSSKYYPELYEYLKNN